MKSVRLLKILKGFNIVGVALAIVPLLVGFVKAAPVISSVVGAVSNRTTLLVQGSGFGVKSPAAPIVWADFEGGNINPSPSGQRSSWSANDNMVVSNSNQL